MSTLAYILIFSSIGSLVSLFGGVLLLSSKKTAKKLALYATPFAGGALLAAVFLDLLPEGIVTDSAGNVLLAALLGVVAFFLAEGFLHWFHHHHEHEANSVQKKDPRAWLVIIGDTLHNALDGIAIAASFMVSIPTGIVTTIAVAAHEIPQEIGDFGLLLSKGMRRKSVLLVNVISALATVVAAVVTYVLGSGGAVPLGVLLGVSAGFLLYIATSDIIPTIHAKQSPRRLFDIQAVLLVLGVITVGLVTTLAHRYIDTEHNHTHDPSVTQQVEDHHHEDEDDHDGDHDE